MFKESLRRKLKLYETEGALEQVAIVFSGRYHTSFLEIQELAQMVVDGAEEVIAGPHPLILSSKMILPRCLETPLMYS